MIEFYKIGPVETTPDLFLSNAVIAVICLATAGVAAFSAARWNWKGWPLALLAAVTLPFLIMLAFAFSIYYFAYEKGEAGDMTFHAWHLILFAGVPSALVGFGGALIVRRVRSNKR